MFYYTHRFILPEEIVPCSISSRQRVTNHVFVLTSHKLLRTACKKQWHAGPRRDDMEPESVTNVGPSPTSKAKKKRIYLIKNTFKIQFFCKRNIYNTSILISQQFNSNSPLSLLNFLNYMRVHLGPPSGQEPGPNDPAILPSTWPWSQVTALFGSLSYTNATREHVMSW